MDSIAKNISVNLGATPPIVKYIGQWGQRWARDFDVDDLNPRHLIWNVHLRMNLDTTPSGRTTIELEFMNLRQIERHYWIVVNERIVDAWRGFWPGLKNAPAERTLNQRYCPFGGDVSQIHERI